MERIIKNEQQYLYKEIDTKLLEKTYSFVDKNIDNFETIKKILIEENIEKKYESIKEFKNLIEKNFNNTESFYDYMSIFIIESFNDGTIELSWDKDKIKTIHNNMKNIQFNMEKLNIFIRRKNSEIEFFINDSDKYVLKIIEILSLNKIIIKHDILINNKTHYMLELKGMFLHPNVKIYQEKFEGFYFRSESYIYSLTFNSIIPLCSQNPLTNNFKMGDDKFSLDLLNRKILIDLKMLEKIKNHYFNEFSIDEEIIYDEYENLLKNHSNFLKENDIDAIKESSKRMSIIQKAIIFKYIIDNKIEWCYASILLDFRGRIYKTSNFSLTFIKEFRICSYFGFYDDNFFENYKEGKTDKIVNKYLLHLEKLKTGIDWSKKNIIIKRAILWTLISLAEVRKKELGSQVTLLEFIIKGIQMFNSNYTSKDYEEKILIIYYYSIIEMLIYENRIKINTISKDATASVYQHLVKILLPLNDKSLAEVNLDSNDTWYDTYEILIERWKKEKKDKIKSIKFDELEKYFNRKNLKKILMTQNYGCGWRKCYNYFFEQFENLDENNKKKMGKLLHSFYNFIVYEKTLFKNDKNIIEEYMIGRNYKELKMLDNSSIDLRYFNQKIKRIDNQIKNKRYTIILHSKTNIMDIDKTNRSLLANFVHTQDAALARDVVTKITCMPVHDCFIIGCLEVSNLIDIVNKCMNITYCGDWDFRLNKEIYSIFILL